MLAICRTETLSEDQTPKIRQETMVLLSIVVQVID